MTEKKVRLLIQIGTVLAVVLFFVLAGVLLVQSIHIKVSQKKLAELNTILNSVTSERDTVEKEIEYRKSEAYIEEYARQYLNMQKADEKKFLPEN